MKKVLSIIMLLSLTSCVPFILGVTTGSYLFRNQKGIGGKISDVELAVKIGNSLKYIPNEIRRNIFYAVKNGEVLLTGIAPNINASNDVIDSIKTIPSISNIYNEIQIGESYSTIDSCSDNLMIADFNARAMIDINTKFLNYKIIVFKFNIYLIGTVETEEELNSVINIAKSLVGVKKIVSYIKVINKI